MAVNEGAKPYRHPIYDFAIDTPGLSVALAPIDRLLTWGLRNSLWVFPMATSCCGIEFMAAAASRVDLDRMGTIVRASPRQADVMIVAGTITVKMAPRVKRLWDQMPEPKWCIAMGSCAISGDFYRNLYSVVPGIDTFLPVDVYIPGCPPNPEAVMQGLLTLQEKVERLRRGELVAGPVSSSAQPVAKPSIARLGDPTRPADLSSLQVEASLSVIEEGDPGEHAPESAHLVPLRIAAESAHDYRALLETHFHVTEFPEDAPPVVATEHHLELAATLQAWGYRQLVFIAATHHPANGATEGHDVTYALRSVGAGSKLVSWRVRAQSGVPVPSLSHLFAGADWQEREQYDLLGVRFSDHPDLRRIFLPENWEGHPLRRDYPADTPCAPWR